MAKDYNGNIEDEPVAFIESSVLENIVTGESLKIILGKILKAFNVSTGQEHIMRVQLALDKQHANQVAITVH